MLATPHACSVTYLSKAVSNLIHANSQSCHHAGRVEIYNVCTGIVAACPREDVLATLASVCRGGAYTP